MNPRTKERNVLRSIVDLVKVGLDTLDNIQAGEDPLNSLSKAWSRSELSKRERPIGFRSPLTSDTPPIISVSEPGVTRGEYDRCHHGHVRRTCIYCKARQESAK
jgi:hypothetical protein